MIGELKLLGYRGFECYRLSGLRRVNLLVGKNNSGKTSVLEATQLLAAGKRPDTLSRHMEARRGKVPHRILNGYSVIDILPIFRHHNISLGSFVDIQSNDTEVQFNVGSMSDLSRPMFHDLLQSISEIQSVELPEFTLSISRVSQNSSISVFALSKSGLLFVPVGAPENAFEKAFRAQFLTSASLYPAELQLLWDNALRQSREDEAVEVLRTIQPDIGSLHFLSSTETGVPEILAGMTKKRSRVPLDSFGEGMRRLLALSLSLSDCTDGLLLVDEIDTGLHWTVMEDLWQLVIGAARDRNVQVFATTHSYDCVKGLASLLEREPELAEEVSLQKLERRLDEAVALRGEQLPIAITHNIELR